MGSRFPLTLIAVALLSCGPTRIAEFVKPAPTALTARVHPAGTALSFDASTAQYRVGTLSIHQAAPAFDLGTDVHLAYTSGPFSFSAGTRHDEVIAYRSNAASLVLTPGLHGVKEDLILHRAGADTLELTWSLTLADDLTARLEPAGGIGIYRNRVRTYEVPAPTLRDASGVERSTGLRFELEGTTLRLQAEGLADLRYPVDIDPTVVTTTADFLQGGNLESDVSAAGNQLTRVPPTKAVNAWVSTTAFPTARSRHTSVVANGFLYVIGGHNGSVALNDVRYAPIAADGSLGAWQLGTPFTTARSRHASVAYNGTLYVVGGLGPALLSDVQYAHINSDGSLTPWVTASALPSGRSGHSVVAANGYLYCLGGATLASPLNEVLSALVNPDGSLGPWMSTTPFANPRSAFGAAANNGVLYITGGNGAAVDYDDTQFAALGPNGTVGSWAISGLTLPSTRRGHAMVASGGALIVTGGFDGVKDTNQVLLARFNGDGSLGAWQSQAAQFTNGRNGHTSVVANGTLYVIGGFSMGVQNDVQTSLLDTGGTLGGDLGPWSATTPLTLARWGHTSVALNGYVYAISGVNQAGMYLTDVSYARPNADGSITRWDPTTPLPTGRQLFGAATWNGRIYVTGGDAGFLNDVVVSTANPDGTLGPWTTAGTFTTARYGHATAAYNGFLYVYAGANSADVKLADVQFAAIKPDGTLGPFAATTPLTTARYVLGGVAQNGFLYAVGGATGMFGPWVGEVNAAPINADGTLGAWVNTTALATPRGYHATLAYNGWLMIGGGFGGPGFLSDVAQAPLNADGTIGSWVTVPSFSGARAYQSAAGVNGKVYLIGGSTGGSTFNDVLGATVLGPLAIGQYSRLFDFGVNTSLNSVVATGSASNTGMTSVAFETAPSGGPFGFPVDKHQVPLGQSTALSVTARYLWLRLTLDDTGNTTAVTNGRERDVDDVTVTVFAPLGTPCSSGTECLSTFCAWGVCCNSLCDRGCEACNLTGLVGVCSLEPMGYAGTPSCSPYLCGGNPSCPTMCFSDMQCISTSYCASTSCVPKLANGAVCGGSNECVSGQCIDGYCCNTACGGACDACNLPGNLGTCRALAAGAAGAPSCAPYVCGGSTGACGSSCTTDTQCAATAFCNGTTCIAKRANGVACTAGNQCQTGQCIDGVCCNSACGGACDACNVTGSMGVCQALAAGAPGTPACTPYLCGGAASCPTACTVDTQCTPAAFCNGTACVPKRANGGACTAANQCSSNQCVDGVCCNTACGAACDACDVVGSEGTCTFSPKGSPGAPPCAPMLCTGNLASCPTSCTDDASCAVGQYCLNSVCQGRLDPGFACTDPNECVSRNCVDGVCCNSACGGACDACNVTGSVGQCTAVAVGGVGAPSCAPFVCYGSADCPTSCTTDVQCSSSTYCQGGACVPRQVAGAVCATPRQCASGFCADGVCCNASCDGSCDSCNLTGSVGACTVLPAGTPGAPSCAPYVCTGAAACPTACANDTSCTNLTVCAEGVCGGSRDGGPGFVHQYGVGCGCDSAGSGVMVLLALLALLRQARSPQAR